MEGPTARKLLLIWAGIGAQSFGGGPTTLLFIQREMVERRGWLSEAEFVRFWALCPLVPGINLIGFAILIGRRLAGWRGIAATLAGMLLPSAIITTVLTAGFSSLQGWPPFQSALRGLIPATAGLMFVLALQMGRPVFKEVRQEGWPRLATAVGFVLCAAVLLGWLQLPSWLVLLMALVAGAFLLSFKVISPPVQSSIEEIEEIEGVPQ